MNNQLLSVLRVPYTPKPANFSIFNTVEKDPSCGSIVWELFKHRKFKFNGQSKTIAEKIKTICVFGIDSIIMIH